MCVFLERFVVHDVEKLPQKKVERMDDGNADLPQSHVT